MKKNIFWGILFILIAVALILKALNVDFGIAFTVPIWKIILGLALLFFIIEQIAKKHFTNAIFPLVFIAMVFENELAFLMGIESGDIASTWVFLLIGLCLTIGVGLITENGANFTFTVKNKNGEKVYSGAEGRKKYKEMRESNSVYYLDCSAEINQEFEINLGKAEIFFSNVEFYDNGGVININNNLGKVVFHIPQNWIIVCNISNSLGVIKTPPTPPTTENVKKITVNGENNLGTIEFLYNE